MDKIETVEGLVEALGGPSALARELGIGQSGVSNWILRDEIPPGWHLRLYMRCRELGIDVHPKIFGLDAFPTERPSRALERTTSAA